MNEQPQPPISANIREIGGPYYSVMLYAVPQVGQLMKLYSYIDAAEKKDPMMNYEVVQVVHEVRDVSDKIPQSKGGCHMLTVFVKRTSNSFLSS